MKEDENAVKLLVESTFPVFSKGKYWDWKYLKNPNFDRSFAAVAKVDKKIVGCNHWLPRKVKLSDSIVVDSMMGANIAVTAEYRRMGVGRALIHFLRSQHNDRKPALMYMIADPALRRRFHASAGGYTPVPGGTVLYRKILNWNKVKISAAAFNEKVNRGEFEDRLAKVDLTVAFKMHGAPPLGIHLDHKGVEVGVAVESADVTISSDMATLNMIKDGRIGLRMLFWSWLTGRLKYEGSLRKMLAVYRNMWAFREILSPKIT
jgi:predicted N-acetyltransferase YhbS